MTLDEINSTPFVFIVGRGRSGTTLLQTILDSHPQIQFPIESRLIMHLSMKYTGEHKLTEQFINTLLDDLYFENKFRTHWKIEKNRLKSVFLENLNHIVNFETICKIIYLKYPSIFIKSHILLIGDKNPTYSLFTNQLIKLFPTAKFIHMVRNPKDNIVSHGEVFNRTNVSLMAQGWLFYNQLIEKSKNKYFDKFITIRYEDLVTNPANELDQISKHINIDVSNLKLSSEIKSNEKYQTLLRGKEFDHFHKNLLKPINSEQIGKWRMKLGSDEINLIEYITHREAKKYNYAVEAFSKKTLYPLKSMIARWKYHILIQYIHIYYLSPMAFRRFSSGVSTLLNKLFKYSNYFNTGDYRFKN